MKSRLSSIEQLAGQRLMVGFDGTGLNADLKYHIDTLKIGGMILFSRNIESPGQIQDLCRSAQAYARDRNQPPLFIAVDQEGGRVARLKEPFTRFPGNPMIKEQKDAVHFAETTARELKSIGINMNMAPVLDVTPDDGDYVMAERVFGSDPKKASDLGVTVIEHLQKNAIMAVAKHFPGIGRTTLDSHQDMPVLSVDASDLEKTDLKPFRAAVNGGVAGVMLSHVRYEKIDPDWPASLSPKIVRSILRDRMGFDGLVMTDDLDMGAIGRNYSFQTVIEQVLSADIDIILICHKGPNIQTAFEKTVDRIAGSSEYRLMGEKSVERILKLKQQYLSA